MSFRQCCRLRAAVAVLATVVALAGCASGSSLAVAPQTGTVRVYNAGQVEDWPAQFVHRDLPGVAFTGPFSKQLWDLGHRLLPFHCFWLDPSGSPTRVTLMGLIKATADKNGKGLFGGRLSPADIAIAQNDGSRLEVIFINSIMTEAQGDPARVQQLLNASLEHDTKCLRIELVDLQLRVRLNQENKALVSDETGQQIAITIAPRPDYTRKNMHWIETHAASVRDVRRIYEDIAAKLTTRLARSVPRVAAPSPVPPQRDLPGLPQQKTRPTPVPTAFSGRITANTAPLQEIERQAENALKEIREACLRTARIGCG